MKIVRIVTYQNAVFQRSFLGKRNKTKERGKNMEPIHIAILGVIALLVLLFMGMNIGTCMFAVGFFGSWVVFLAKGLSIEKALNAALIVFQKIPFTQATNYTFVVIPLFVLMGQLCYYSGMSAGLYNMCSKLLSNLKGGLAMATVAACGCFGAICGSSAATAATMGVVALPEMKKHGYKDSLACGSIAAGGTLGILIPPSTGFILYGIIAGESIGKLFAAGILPGILLAVCYCISIAIQVRVKPDLAPNKVKTSLLEKVKALPGGIPMVILFLVAIGGIMTGFFTAVEASAMGVFCAFIYMLFKRTFNWKVFKASLIETVKTSGMMFLILIGAYVFGNFLTVTGLPTALASFIGGLNVSKWIILFIILVIYAVMGCLMDSLAMVLITVPIFYPVMMQLGFDGIWYGVIMVMVMELGLITPPVGMNCYIVAGVAKDVPLWDIFKGVAPCLVGMVVAVILVCAFPQIALVIPNMLTI